jgi:hypothetical protein
MAALLDIEHQIHAHAEQGGPEAREKAKVQSLVMKLRAVGQLIRPTLKYRQFYLPQMLFSFKMRFVSSSVNIPYKANLVKGSPLFKPTTEMRSTISEEKKKSI